MEDLNISANKPDNQQLAEKAKRFLTVPRTIFAILGIIILIEIIYVVSVLLTSSPSIPSASRPTQKPNVQLTGGKISLTAPKANFRVAEVVPVSVSVYTGSHTVNGVDLIVRFDPKILEATSGGAVKGKIFDEYPLVSLDQNKGLISISGINNFKNGFSGTGQFATVNLRAKMTGKTSLVIDFNKGSTTDSNLVETETSEDILEQVNNLQLTVQ